MLVMVWFDIVCFSYDLVGSIRCYLCDIFVGNVWFEFYYEEIDSFIMWGMMKDKWFGFFKGFNVIKYRGSYGDCFGL